jgi:hypothetical protein
VVRKEGAKVITHATKSTEKKNRDFEELIQNPKST